MGPPEDIPATIEAEIPNQELVRPKPTPRIDHNENDFLKCTSPPAATTPFPLHRPMARFLRRLSHLFCARQCWNTGPDPCSHRRRYHFGYPSLF